MKIIHRVATNPVSDPRLTKLATDLDLIPEPAHRRNVSADPVVFELAEDDPRWHQVSKLIRDAGAMDVPDTFFTEQEVLASSWLRATATFEWGYPEPEASWATNPINYAEFCRECGSFVQAAPFRVKQEPSMGRNHFMRLGWTNALLCRNPVQEILRDKSIRGYEFRDIIVARGNSKSQEVGQLYPTTTTGPGLIDQTDLLPRVCRSCGLTKFNPHRRGVMRIRGIAFPPEVDILRSSEWFGTGGFAFQEVLVSHMFAGLVLKQGWKGLRFKVVEVV